MLKVLHKNSQVCILFLIMLLFNSACTNQVADEPNKADRIKLVSDDGKPYIGFVLDTLKEERWYKDKALFEEKVVQMGGQVKTLAANGLDDIQIKQAELLIQEGADVLVVVPHNAEISGKIVEMAHKAGVKVISYDRLIKNSKVDYYISFDNEKVGELQASEVVKKVSKGNFAYIGGAESDNNAVLFREGAMKVIQPLIDKGDIKIVYDQYTDEWKPETAQENMQSALQQNSNQIDAVIAANDGTAGGVINALSSAGLSGNIPVSGQDAELMGVKRIVEGTQTMTVYKPITLLAEKVAEVAVKAAKGEKVATDRTVNNGEIDVPSILLDPIAVTKNNIKDTVIKDGYLTEEELYKK
ncbi:substrate-binding domain-containing protein [Metabacillus sp. FJAT-52054]|uniref:Substrate-binding domain-containing protein n=1 Tax=Metabacillus sediminis TaxID=3117746 RepID=A0ABZ2NI93_9BACI